MSGSAGTSVATRPASTWLASSSEHRQRRLASRTWFSDAQQAALTFTAAPLLPAIDDRHGTRFTPWSRSQHGVWTACALAVLPACAIASAAPRSSRWRAAAACDGLRWKSCGGLLGTRFLVRRGQGEDDGRNQEAHEGGRGCCEALGNACPRSCFAGRLKRRVPVCCAVGVSCQKCLAGDLCFVGGWLELVPFGTVIFAGDLNFVSWVVTCFFPMVAFRDRMLQWVSC